MAFKFGNGIQLTTGYSLQAEIPLDVRAVVETLEDRNSLIDQHGAYEGMLVYVKETHATYVRTATAPSDSDYSACWRTISSNESSVDPDAEAVLTTGDQSIAGTKTFTGKVVVPEPTAGTDAATKNYVDQEITENVTEQIGATIQAHSDQLDKFAALSTTGIVTRRDDGTIATHTISGTNGHVTVATDTAAGTTTIGLPNVGTAGTYFKVTTDAQGRVTAGENPTTVDGFGITDAVHKTGDTMTGLLKYTSETNNESTFDENTLVTKKYADSVALGFVFHVACKTGTNENIAGIYTNGNSQPDYPGVGATLVTSVKTIGDVVLAEGDRVLLTGQTDAKQNGAYVVTSIVEANVTLTRADDLDGHPHIKYNGASFLIAEGKNKGQVWRVSNTGEITFGTDDITFVQVFAPTPLQAGAGIKVTGSTIALAAGNTVGVVADKVEVLSGTGNNGKVLFANGDGTAASWKEIAISDIKSGVLPIENGGTGNANAANGTFKLGTNITFVESGAVEVTLPTYNGTVATLAGAEVLTNKTVKADTAGQNALVVQNGNITGESYQQGDQLVLPKIEGFMIDCGTY